MTSPDTYFSHARPEMRQLVPEAADRLLEIGCSSGLFSASLRRPGRILWGIEPNSTAAKSAAERLDRVIQSPIEDAVQELQDASMDCVIANDVLEHLVDPWATLRLLRRVLAPGGSFVASIPNIRHVGVIKSLWVDGRWDYADEGILDRTHLRFFTPATMREMFASTGYQVEVCVGINGEPLPLKFALLSRMLCREPGQMGYRQFGLRARLA